MSRDGMLARLRHRASDPVLWSEAIQLLKTAAAAVAAWLLATHLLELPLSFLAPWAALLVVHSTVYRTFSQGARQVVATVLGVLVAWSVGNLLGLDATAVSVVLLVGLVLGSIRWFGDEQTTVAATALIVLTTSLSAPDTTLLLRLADTGVGVATGVLVNLIVWPPLRRRTAIAAMDALDGRIGRLLTEMGDGLTAGMSPSAAREWLEESRALDEDLDRAWALVRQAGESARLNPRRSAGELRDPTSWVDLLQRIEQAVAEVRSTAHTLARGLADDEQWQASFRDGYADVLRAAGHAITDSDPDLVRACHRRLDDLAARVRDTGSGPRLWPVYGGLLVNLRNILDAMDEVAAANPLRQPPTPLRRRR